MTSFIVIDTDNSQLYHYHMNKLEEISKETAWWNLDEFVAIANQLLPGYISASIGDARVKETLSGRLVRSYTTQGLMDDSAREGRHARYTYRHLLQLLVVRRLVSDGQSVGSLADRIRNSSDADLENLLQGGMQYELKVANPAMAFLQQVRNRGTGGINSNTRPTVATTPVAPTTIRNTLWTRVEVIDGLEIHISERFPEPGSKQEIESIINSLESRLKAHWAGKQQQKRGKHG